MFLCFFSGPLGGRAVPGDRRKRVLRPVRDIGDGFMLQRLPQLTTAVENGHLEAQLCSGRTDLGILKPNLLYYIAFENGHLEAQHLVHRCPAGSRCQDSRCWGSRAVYLRIKLLSNRSRRMFGVMEAPAMLFHPRMVRTDHRTDHRTRFRRP